MSIIKANHLLFINIKPIMIIIPKIRNANIFVNARNRLQSSNPKYSAKPKKQCWVPSFGLTPSWLSQTISDSFRCNLKQNKIKSWLN